MKKLCLYSLVLGVMIAVSGCNSSVIDEVVMSNLDLNSDSSYQQYTQLKEDERLDDDGYYRMMTFEAEQEENIGTGTIMVSFANNPYLDIVYYTDSQLACPISGSVYKLNSGDAIYASVISDNPACEIYGLKEFRILACDLSSYNEISRTQFGEDRLVYKIPVDYSGENIMIVPIGEYPNTKLNLSAYFVDSQGNKHELKNAGAWSVDSIEVDDDTNSIAYVREYSVQYDFDNQEYFFVSATPAITTKDPTEDGRVQFEILPVPNGQLECSVELSKYLYLNITFSAQGTLSFNGEIDTLKKNKTWENSHLKYGDIIEIECAEPPTISGDYQHVQVIKDQGSTKYKLKIVAENVGNIAEESFELVNLEREFEFELNSNCSFGECFFELEGEAVSGRIKAKEGQELEIICMISDPDYVFAQKSDGIKDVVKGFLRSKKQRITIQVTSELDGTTIYADSFFEVLKKEG